MSVLLWTVARKVSIMKVHWKENIFQSNKSNRFVGFFFPKEHIIVKD
jgi:hypothetical protein